MDIEAAKNALYNFWMKNKRMPSYAEAAIIFNFSSKDSAHRMMASLIKAGIVAKDKTGKIIPKNIEPKIKVLGVIEAGFPTPAEENLLNTVTLDDYLIDDKNASFMLQVKGDSMIEAGILPGDFVIVERGLEAKTGDIVIAEIDGAWTMKYLRKDKDGLYLEPANKKYKALKPTSSFSITAVVKSVVRKL